MGAMIERADTKIVFDPLFHYEHDTYDRVPAEVETALLAGTEPWDGIDAVFISHHHGDHFDPATILELLRARQTIELFGPEQAAAAIRELVADPSDPLLKRVHGLSLENGMAATDIKFGPLLVEAVRIPHSGWPDRRADVENIVFRVTLDKETTDALWRRGHGRCTFREESGALDRTTLAPCNATLLVLPVERRPANPEGSN